MSQPLISPPRAVAPPAFSMPLRDTDPLRTSAPAAVPRNSIFCTLDPATCFGRPQGSAVSLAG